MEFLQASIILVLSLLPVKITNEKEQALRSFKPHSCVLLLLLLQLIATALFISFFIPKIN